MFQTQIPYCSGRDLSKPNSALSIWMNSSVTSTWESPRYKSIGSGPNLVRMKMTKVAPMIDIKIEIIFLSESVPFYDHNSSITKIEETGQASRRD